MGARRWLVVGVMAALAGTGSTAGGAFADTVAPVLVVGSLWNPSTNYSGAVSTSRLLPNSRLLSSDNRGHTAYALSACATAAIDSYLLTGKAPARDTVCVESPEPFAERRGQQLPPIAPPFR